MNTKALLSHKSKSKEVSDCECIKVTLGILGDKWTALLIEQLSECPRTFSELESSLAPISPRTLSHRLRKLQQENIVYKEQYHQKPNRYKYAVTQKGKELKSVLGKMFDWGKKFSAV